MANKTALYTQRAITLAICATIGLAAAPSFADVKAGVDAWSTGDFEGAVNEWRMPAQNGDADALFNLAQAYRLGRGVPADVDRARELYAEAASKGHIKAADNYGLLLFQQGDQSVAMPLIRAAAERGDPRAQYVLGLAHFNADYAERDWVRAYALLTLSRSAGLPQAGGALGEMDKHVPLEKRQQAQLLAREIDARAGQIRASQVAAADLGRVSGTVPPEPVAAPAARIANTPASAAPVRAVPNRPVPVPVAQRPVSSQATNTGPWRVQLGAFGVASNADRLWNKVSGSSALAGKQKMLVPAGKVTRLQAGGFSSRSEAERVCDSLKRQGQACMVAKS
ncbi:MAG: SPOR domain-containing protein [Pseudomonadota bacterium]